MNVQAACWRQYCWFKVILSVWEAKYLMDACHSLVHYRSILKILDMFNILGYHRFQFLTISFTYKLLKNGLGMYFFNKFLSSNTRKCTNFQTVANPLLLCTILHGSNFSRRNIYFPPTFRVSCLVFWELASSHRKFTWNLIPWAGPLPNKYRLFILTFSSIQ